MGGAGPGPRPGHSKAQQVACHPNSHLWRCGAAQRQGGCGGRGWLGLGLSCVGAQGCSMDRWGKLLGPRCVAPERCGLGNVGSTGVCGVWQRWDGQVGWLEAQAGPGQQPQGHKVCLWLSGQGECLAWQAGGHEFAGCGPFSWVGHTPAASSGLGPGCLSGPRHACLPCPAPHVQ